MRLYLTVLLVALMIDWIFFSGIYVALPLGNSVSAGAGFAADLVMKQVG